MEHIQLQLHEIELLQCMYPSKDEFKIQDVTVLADMYQYVNGEIDTPPGNLAFTVQFVLERECGGNLVFHVDAFFPLDYPKCHPVLSVKCGQLLRDQNKELNRDLREYVCTLENGEICMINVLQWFQDYGLKYTQKTEYTNMDETTAKEKINAAKYIFSRYLIHSHHIYGKDKRRNILEWAGELSLSGFCLPGKPGCICVEGQRADCEEFWSRTRLLNWRKITLRHQEEFQVEGEAEIEKLRCFSKFEEINFDPHTCHGGRENIMNKGTFYQFLVAHTCQHIFSYFFNIEGQISKQQI
ncbi:RWD domain-containing protein 2B-like [Polyodon spathula]|uniref:RWD domain-containing protein 2B-like n=1 Tax=Polyodon spathula TaxID=7913 RepID=UPI001B7DD69B|nr:RWD domain-containing protein 2B-like [Polyodon spathula]